MKSFAKLALSFLGDGTCAGSGLGFGCMGITAFYGDTMADDKAMELLKVVYDGGCRHFDTAEAYATKESHNEAILGKFFQTVPRDSFSVATKFAPTKGVYDYETVKASLQKSLERLQLEYVDLYYAHRVISLQGGKEFVRTALRLKEEGLIREIGLSEVNAAWLKEIHTDVGPVDAVQQEWSLLTRSLEDELVPMCRELNVTVVAYSPLARNLLAQKVLKAPSDFRSTVPRFSDENLKKNQAIFDQVQALAEKYQCTAAQLSLKWLFHRAQELGVQVVPIPGSTKVANVRSNMKSTNVRTLDKNDMEMLESLAEQVAGMRGNEGYMSLGFEVQKRNSE